MKKQSNLSRLMGYAGGHKILTYLSWVLSVMSALLALVPFWYIWCIIHDILEVSPDFSQAENVTGYGWSAVLFAVISIVVYIPADNRFSSDLEDGKFAPVYQLTHCISSDTRTFCGFFYG